MYTIVQNTVGRELQCRFLDTTTGSGYDITGASELAIIIRKNDGTQYIRTNASVVAGTSDTVAYRLAADDTDTLGNFTWRVRYTEGGTGTVMFSQEFRAIVVP